MDHIISFEVDFTSSTVNQILQHVAPSENGFVWAERPDAWTFSKWHGVNATLQVYQAGKNVDEASFVAGDWLGKSYSGRWFNSECQTSWRRILVGDEEIVRIVCLTTESNYCDACESVAGARQYLATSSDELGLADFTEQYLLWGQQTENSPNHWIDLSIPHRLCYPLPIPNSHFVSLVAKRWCDRTGRTHFLRYTDLVPASQEATSLDDQAGALQ